MKKNKTIFALFLASMLSLGLTLGASITSFILFLNKNDSLLAILAYIFLALFALFIVITMFIFYQYKNKLFVVKEGIQNEEEK